MLNLILKNSHFKPLNIFIKIELLTDLLLNIHPVVTFLHIMSKTTFIQI